MQCTRMVVRVLMSNNIGSRHMVNGVKHFLCLMGRGEIIHEPTFTDVHSQSTNLGQKRQYQYLLICISLKRRWKENLSDAKKAPQRVPFVEAMVLH